MEYEARPLFLVPMWMAEALGSLMLAGICVYAYVRSSPSAFRWATLSVKALATWTGHGYPLGLKGEEIPLECRILAIADAFDAMTSQRPYRKKLTTEQAADELLRCSGTQFDPRLMEVFLRVIGTQSEIIAT